jgi:dsDNA-specific endonuclease/ATPase MutS2
MVELHKQEKAEMRYSTDALGLKFDRVSEIVTEIINDYGQVKQVIKEWEKCYQRTEEKFRHLDEERRKNNIIIFGLQERGDESYLETMDMVVKFMCDKMRVEISRERY